MCIGVIAAVYALPPIDAKTLERLSYAYPFQRRSTMPASKRKPGTKDSRHLTLAPQVDTYLAEADIPVDRSVRADLSLDVTEGDFAVRLEVAIEFREYALANGQPIL